MQQRDFHLILKNYLLGQATEEEEELIDSWYADLGKDAHSSLNSLEESELERHYWSNIAAYMKQSKKKNGRVIRWYPVGIAASVLLALVSFAYIINGNRASEKGTFSGGKEGSSFTRKKMANSGTTPQIIFLPDSST